MSGSAGNDSFDVSAHRVTTSHKVVPRDQQAQIRELYVLRYDRIIEIDPLGDVQFEGPHVFCRYSENGPYAKGPFPAAWFMYPGSRFQELDPTKQTKLFVPGLIKVKYGDFNKLGPAQFATTPRETVTREPGSSPASPPEQ
ncbi:MAG TPA: hypothetical protein VEP48_06610 [Methylomirabilota bacterium]|nr:hypothetical protein [Methylomirabilota bacterium]